MRGTGPGTASGRQVFLYSRLSTDGSGVDPKQSGPRCGSLVGRASPAHLGSGSQDAGEGGRRSACRDPHALRVDCVDGPQSAAAAPFPPVAVDARRVASSPQRPPPAAYATAMLRSKFSRWGPRVAVPRWLPILSMTLSEATSWTTAKMWAAADGGWGDQLQRWAEMTAARIFRRGTQGSRRSGLGIGRYCEARQRALSHGFAGVRHRGLRPRPGGEKHKPGFEMQGAGDQGVERRLRRQRVVQDGVETEGVRGGS
ncbi:hypothetical protein QBC39DRAFT_8363 [Podospora conica]|nr:hypothetical protein QBC39DRAFT_8363 [Schizothecium conicum]